MIQRSPFLNICGLFEIDNKVAFLGSLGGEHPTPLRDPLWNQKRALTPGGPQIFRKNPLDRNSDYHLSVLKVIQDTSRFPGARRADPQRGI